MFAQILYYGALKYWGWTLYIDGVDTVGCSGFSTAEQCAENLAEYLSQNPRDQYGKERS